MAQIDQKRRVLKRVLAERREELPRPARQFLDQLLQDDRLLEQMRFCRWEERSHLRNSVLIATEEGVCWAVLLGNEPEAGRKSSLNRARLALEGLDLTPAQVLQRLRLLPVWFLALDETYAAPPAGEAARIEQTLHRLAAMEREEIRRRAILDQIDAALDAGDREAYERLQAMLRSA